MDSQELASELAQIYAILTDLPKGDIGGIQDDLASSNGWLARSAVLEAEAQNLLDRKRGTVCEKYLDSPATQLRVFLDSECSEERRLFHLADRLNATLSHRIDSLRSLLSFEKQQRIAER